MIEKLEELYKKELSFPVILFGKRKIMFFVFLSLYICLSLGSIILWSLKFKVFATISSVFFVIEFIFYFWLAKKLLYRKYGAKTSVVPDFYQAVKPLRIKILRKFLAQGNYLHKIDRIIALLNKKATNKKISPIFNTGLLLFLFLPLWDQMVSQVTKGVDLFDTRNFLAVFSITVLIYWAIWMLKSLKDSLYELLDLNSQKYSTMANLLEEISLEIEDTDDKTK